MNAEQRARRGQIGRSRPGRRPLSRAGFTLIEVVIALTILVFLVGAAYASLSRITMSKKILDDRREVQRIAGGIFYRLSRELQLADASSQRGLLRSKDDSGKPTSSRIVLEGEETNLVGRPADTITFVAREGGQYLPDGGMHTGFVQISYRVARQPKEEAKRERDRAIDEEKEPFYLVRDELPYVYPYDRAAENRMTFPVAKNVVALRFKYYDPEKEEWTGEWDNKAYLPSLVSIALTLRSPNGREESYLTQVALGAFREKSRL